MDIITKCRFCLFYRTYTAKNICKHLRCIFQFYVVLCINGNIILITCKQYQIFSFKVNGLNNMFINLRHCLVVFQFRIFQIHKQLMLVTVNNLLIGKLNINKIFTQCSGKSFFNDSKNFFSLFPWYGSEKLIKFRDYFLIFINIASSNI